jgi:hypothetical protein
MPYRNIEEYPFYPSIYPPVYHLTLVPFVWLFGPALWYGRVFSFLTTLITALAIGYAVWRDGDLNGRSKWIAVVSGLAYLASNYVYHNGPLVRQHITMMIWVRREVRLNMRDSLWVGKTFKVFKTLKVLTLNDEKILRRNEGRGQEV